jgi:hypothetical protein
MRCADVRICGCANMQIYTRANYLNFEFRMFNFEFIANVDM